MYITVRHAQINSPPVVGCHPVNTPPFSLWQPYSCAERRLATAGVEWAPGQSQSVLSPHPAQYCHVSDPREANPVRVNPTRQVSCLDSAEAVDDQQPAILCIRDDNTTLSINDHILRPPPSTFTLGVGIARYTDRLHAASSRKYDFAGRCQSDERRPISRHSSARSRHGGNGHDYYY